MKRRLTAAERAELERVFGASIGYERIRLGEAAAWTNTANRLMAWLLRRPPPTGDNAMTLGNIIFFPRRLRPAAADGVLASSSDLDWLVHEATHVWQYQNSGPGYLFHSVWELIRLGPKAYAYGGEHGLLRARESKKTLGDFGVEQQAEIARDYYRRLQAGLDTGLWEPFVAEMKGRPTTDLRGEAIDR
jgi:hypothetical protein